MSKLKNAGVLTTCALLLALSTVLGFFKIPINQLIEIRFGALPIAMAGSLFGPVIGSVIGGVSDVLAYLVKPTGPFFPGFTVSSAIAGVIFGLTLRPRNGKVTLGQIFLSQAIYTIVVGLVINTFNLYFLYGDINGQGIGGYFAFMLTRLPKELVMYPINSLLIAAVIKPTCVLKNRGIIV